jgi:Tol biopolymer transport system component
MVRKYLPFVPFILFGLLLGLSACTAQQSTGTGEASPPAVETPASSDETAAPPANDSGLRPLPVAAVTVEIGVGSPIPVDAVVSGDWPDLCAQLARTEMQVEGGSFEITLLASPADPNCPTDNVGVPYRIAVPLNMVEMAAGSYTVSANGMTTTFEWDPLGTQPPGSGAPGSGARIAYLGRDGNVWVLEWPGGTSTQITSDADAGPMDGTAPTAPIISYYFPAISSDGNLVAYRRDEGTPIESGLNFTFGLWVYDLRTGESRQIIEQNPAGFAWKPGTHLLAYGTGVEEGYFTLRGQTPTAELANGIQGIDLDSGEVSELVRPERGLALYTPAWSPDGRFLSFNELTNYEGMGDFAYYDFEAQEYTFWDEAIGLNDWSPDSSQIAYDMLTYTATGTERIYLSPRTGEAQTPFSPEFEPGYAFNPVFSPQGDRIAYLVNKVGPDDQIHTLVVQDLAGGEPRELGSFESAFGLSWSGDGNYLIFGAGAFQNEQVVAVDVTTGSSNVLAQGTQPAVSGN